MSVFWLIVLVVLLLATLGTLFAGLIVMSGGGEANKKYGNILMRWWVILQFAALAALALIMVGAGG